MDSLTFNFNAVFDKAMMDCATSRYLSVDTETTGLLIRDGRDHCVGVSVSGRNRFDDNKLFSHYFPVAHTENNLSPENKKTFYEYLRIHTVDNPIIYHNAKFDRVSLKTVDMDMDDIFFYDTMIMAHMINENWPSKRLDWLSKHVLHNEGKRKSPLWESFFTLYGWSAKFPSAVMKDYATGDSELTLLLFEYLYREFKRQGFDG